MRWTALVLMVAVGCKDRADPTPTPSLRASTGPISDANRDASTAMAGLTTDAGATQPVHGEMTAEIHQRLNNIPRPLMVSSTEVEAVGFYGDGAGPLARRGSRVRIAVRIWNIVGRDQPSMDGPDPAAVVLQKTVGLTVGKAQYGPLIDAVVVPPRNTDPPNDPGWGMRKGAIRRIATFPGKVPDLAKGIELKPKILVELTLLSL